MSDPLRDFTTEAMKAAPPTMVAALTLNEWVAVATFIYIAVQLAFLLWKWVRLARSKTAQAE